MVNISKEERELRLARAKLTATTKTIRLLIFVRGTFVLVAATVLTLVLSSLHPLNLPLTFAGSLVGIAIFTLATTPIKSIWLSKFSSACQTEQLWDDARDIAMDNAEEAINDILEGRYPRNPFPGLRLKVSQMQLVLIRKGDLKQAARLAEYLHRDSKPDNKDYKTNSLGCILLKVGKYDRGFELLESALTNIESNNRTNSPAHVTSLLGLSQGCIDLERFDKAERYLERLKDATKACHSQKGTNTTDNYVKMSVANPGIEMAFYWYNLSRLRELQGSDEAEATLQKAIDIMKDPDLRKVVVLFYPELILTKATFALSKNDYLKAETLAKEALELYLSDTPNQGCDLTRAKSTIAYAQLKQGRSESAVTDLTECLERFQDLLYEPHPLIATCLIQLGEAYAQAGQTEKARECFKRALETRTKLLPEASPRIRQAEELIAQLPAETAALG